MISYLAVNWLAVPVAAIASFAFGAVWYIGLSKQWLAALGKTREQLQVGNTPFIWSIAMELMMAYFVALLMPLVAGETSVVAGMLVGAQLWLGFVLTTLVLNHRYEGMRWSLTIIDGLHLLGVLVIQGLVIGLFS